MPLKLECDEIVSPSSNSLFYATIVNYYVPSKWKCVESSSIKAFLCTRAYIYFSSSFHISLATDYWLLVGHPSLQLQIIDTAPPFVYTLVRSHGISFLFVRQRGHSGAWCVRYSMLSRVWPFVYIVSFLRLDCVKKKYIRSIRSFHEIPVFQCDDIFEKLHNPFGIVLRRKLGSSTSFIMKVRLMKFSGILNVNSRSPELSFESLAFKFRLDEQTNAFQNWVIFILKLQLQEVSRQRIETPKVAKFLSSSGISIFFIL